MRLTEPTLFEYWCFFMVKDILDEKLKPVRSPRIVRNQKTQRILQEGISITYRGGIRLLYNFSYSGSRGLRPFEDMLETEGYQTGTSYSHSLRPDIVIEKADGRRLILDAKYKGKNGSCFYGEEDEEGTIAKYREEDLDKMHTYRDAIENVFGAFALYPGNETRIFPPHICASPFEGVGALALKPVEGNRAEDEHIQNISKIIDAFIETP